MTDITKTTIQPFNRYWRVARLYPALLSLAPVICSGFPLFPDLMRDYKEGAVSVLVLGCLSYLLSSIARSRGKSIEIRLLEEWGGWPTTLFLRHRDGNLDAITKARYKATLEKMSPELAMPTAAEEAAAPAVADDAYRSATRRLIEARRAPTYRMIADENTSYGFRRNMLGLKSIAMLIAVAAATAIAIGWWLAATPQLTAMSLVSSASRYPRPLILVAIDLALLAVWGVMITPQFVRQAADEYAIALLRSLDVSAVHGA